MNGRVTCGDAVTITAVTTASRTAAYTGGGSAVTSASTVSARLVPPTELIPATSANETTSARL